MSTAGVLLGSFPTDAGPFVTATNPGGVTNVQGITVESATHLWITGRTTGTLYRVTKTGTRINHSFPASVFDPAASSPTGIAFDTSTGRFIDADNNIFENAIEWLADRGITKGCNPPANTKFCPNDFVTRGEMAVFLVRALDYTDNGGGNLFSNARTRKTAISPRVTKSLGQNLVFAGGLQPLVIP